MICVFSGSPLSQKNSNHDINENERHRTTLASSFFVFFNFIPKEKSITAENFINI